MELAYVLLAYGILRWFLGFGEIRGPLAYMINFRSVLFQFC
jgi:hypothetical protein